MPQIAHEPAPARVLLVNLNKYDQPYPVYPVGVAYIDGALRVAGHVTEIWDARWRRSRWKRALRGVHGPMWEYAELLQRLPRA